MIKKDKKIYSSQMERTKQLLVKAESKSYNSKGRIRSENKKISFYQIELKLTSVLETFWKLPSPRMSFPDLLLSAPHQSRAYQALTGATEDSFSEPSYVGCQPDIEAVPCY